MIPVTIHLNRATFTRLEKMAARRGVSMRDMITAGLEPKPVAKAVGNIPSPRTNGYTHLTETEWAEMLRLHAVGWTVPQLAVRFGCSSSTIYKRLQKRGKA